MDALPFLVGQSYGRYTQHQATLSVTSDLPCVDSHLTFSSHGEYGLLEGEVASFFPHLLLPLTYTLLAKELN